MPYSKKNKNKIKKQQTGGILGYSTQGSAGTITNNIIKTIDNTFSMISSGVQTITKSFDLISSELGVSFTNPAEPGALGGGKKKENKKKQLKKNKQN